MEDLCGKLNNSSFMNYVSTFDVACLTETFADSTFDFSGMFTKYKKKKYIAPIKKNNKKTYSTRQTLW